MFVGTHFCWSTISQIGLCVAHQICVCRAVPLIGACRDVAVLVLYYQFLFSDGLVIHIYFIKIKMYYQSLYIRHLIVHFN